MRFFAVAFLILVFGLSKVEGQITVSNAAPNNNPTWLVQNVFVGGNVPVIPQFPPAPTSTQIGYFTANVPNFGIDTGIVMVTAGYNDVVPGQTGSAGGGPATDSDLQTVLAAINSSSTNLNDLVVIEFDFVATSDSVSFEYIFASKEYTSYTCSPFNDVFGFFLSGNGINGNAGFSKINLATIPGSTTPVAINTINQGFPSGSYPASTCLAANPNYVANSVYYVGNSGMSGVNMAGWTVPLKAQAAVSCGNVYHIKLAIADVADGALNSAVFLKAKSFKTPEILVDPVYTNAAGQPDTVMTEGCQPTPLVFKKRGNVSYPMTINYTIGGTAINGVDYQPIIDSIVIPAGQVQDTVWIYPINDNIAEPTETITLTLGNTTTPCFIYPSQVITLYLRDKVPTQGITVVTGGSDTVECPGDQINLQGTASGGEPPLYFAWEGGIVGDAFKTLAPLKDTSITFWVWDNCGDSVSAVQNIYVKPLNPILTQTDSIEICSGDPAYLDVNPTGGRGVLSVSWAQGGFGNSLTVYPTMTTPYRYTVTDECGQQVADTVWVIVHPMPIGNFSYTINPSEKWTFNFTATNQPNVTYLWDFGDGFTGTNETEKHTYLAPGTYAVTLVVTSNEGCVASFIREVEVKSDLILWIPEAFTPNSDGVNDMYLVSVTGIEKFEMMIFNRWGEQIFTSTDPMLGWDGNMPDGKPSPTGVYLVRIFVILPENIVYSEESEIILYR